MIDQAPATLADAFADAPSPRIVAVAPRLERSTVPPVVKPHALASDLLSAKLKLPHSCGPYCTKPCADGAKCSASQQCECRAAAKTEAPKAAPAPAPVSAGDWRELAARPGWEAFGRLDATGTWIYDEPTVRPRAGYVQPVVRAPQPSYSAPAAGPCANGQCRRGFFRR